ncbi:hypothetical protein PS726_00177 [Pseudomonas fluorescens]|jgi:phage tail P2-like protein|uniref:phage tail protein I n=1 Tax=Pseudomonas fluorescens TaxID=294 RepID=UPI00123EED28|nr:phage tail protein I [Pseudomonas fluorescens]VVN67296.1 hypothetical protein PS726_00177 [Pseudomonas fluorescens]
MTASILPANLADLERDLDVALSRIEQVDIPIAKLWDPWACPLDALPYLAWAVSVDQWRSDWPESVKRRVVAGSLDLHRIKGTRPAVVAALKALGVEVELTEWFEASPPTAPGTFTLTAWANENLTPGQAVILNAELYGQLMAAVRSAKNARSHFTFRVGVKFGPNAVALGSAVNAAALARRDGKLKIDASLRAVPVLMGGACGGVSVVRVAMEVGT